MASLSQPRHRPANRPFDVIPGGRHLWSKVGTWERFFILAPALWLGYLLSLLAILVLDPRLSTDSRLYYVIYMFMGLMFTFYLVLLDSWRLPLILSSRVLRVVATMEEFRQDYLHNEGAYVSAIAYLESLGKGGRWLRGNLLSLTFFFAYLIWGAIALRFYDLTGIGDGMWSLAAFFGLHIPGVWLMFWIYHRALKRMGADAARRGYPFLDAGSA